MTNLKRWFFVLAAFITGMVLSFQARVNSFVAEDLGDSFAASAFVFISSGIIVVVVLLMIRRTRKTLGLAWIQVREGQIPPYLLLGGIGGVMGIMAQTFAVQIVGVALFSLAMVLGQMAASSTIDHFGWSLGPRRRFTVVGFVALLLAAVGIVIASSAKFTALPSNAWVYLVLVLIAGIAIAVHMAFNGQITQIVGTLYASVFATYLVGSALLILLGAILLITGLGDLSPFRNVKPFYAVLGIVGPIVVGAAAIVVRYIGPLLFTMGIVTGQLVGSMLLDYLWSVEESLTPTLSTIVGAFLALLSLVLLQLWSQKTTQSDLVEAMKPVAEDSRSTA